MHWSWEAAPTTPVNCAMSAHGTHSLTEVAPKEGPVVFHAVVRRAVLQRENVVDSFPRRTWNHDGVRVVSVTVQSKRTSVAVVRLGNNDILDTVCPASSTVLQVVFEFLHAC
eukprot:2747767-Rhodomonas_salina.2